MLYLNAFDRDGNLSQGPVILALQIFLAGFSCPSDMPHSFSGFYDEDTRAQVCILQTELGFAETDCDGNCGPATRKCVRERFDVDLDAVFAAMPRGPGRYAQDDGSMLEIDQWPLAA